MTNLTKELMYMITYFYLKKHFGNSVQCKKFYFQSTNFHDVPLHALRLFLLQNKRFVTKSKDSIAI